MGFESRECSQLVVVHPGAFADGASACAAMDPVPVFDLFRSIAPSIQGASCAPLRASLLSADLRAIPPSSRTGRAASAAGQAAGGRRDA